MKVENENTKEVILMRLKDVARITGVAKSTILRMVTQNRFPEPIRLTEPRITVWPSDVVHNWVQDITRQGESTSQY